MIKVGKGLSLILILTFVCQDTVFCIPQKNFTLRAPSHFSKTTEAFIEYQYEREKSGRFDSKLGGSWGDVFTTIIGSPKLFDLVSKYNLTLNEYRKVDKRTSLSTNRRDFKKLVEIGYLNCNASGKEHLYGGTVKLETMAKGTFVHKLHSMPYYPQSGNLKEYIGEIRKEVLFLIEKILEKMDNSVVFMFDIDETLVDSKRHPKIVKNFKDLLDVLRVRNHVVGIVTHRVATIQEFDGNNEAGIIERIHKSEQYIKTEEDLVKLGANINDFDFFVIGGLTPESSFVNYVRVKNRWTEKVVERIVPVDVPFKVTKIASLSQVDDILSKNFGLEIFNEAYVVSIDDDLSQGHSMMHGQPHIAEHAMLVDQFFPKMKESKSIGKTLKRIQKFGGVLIPHIDKGGRTLSFFNTPGAKKFEIFQRLGSEQLNNAYFAFEIEIGRAHV
jgi:cob(I)alamin adenosyltransferase